MTIQEVIKLIASEGLAIVAVPILCFFIWKYINKDKEKNDAREDERIRQQNEREDKILNELKTSNEANRNLLDTNKDLSETNRMLVEQFTKKIEIVEEDVKEIKSDIKTMVNKRNNTTKRKPKAKTNE